LLSFALYGKISKEKGVFRFMRMEDLQMLMNSGEYLDLVQSIKQEIQSAQYRAVLNVNRDLICLYYDIGSAINEHKTWGNKFIENLATDIRLAFPEAKGYSVRNLKYMAKFATTYQARAQLGRKGVVWRGCGQNFHGLIM